MTVATVDWPTCSVLLMASRRHICCVYSDWVDLALKRHSAVQRASLLTVVTGGTTIDTEARRPVLGMNSGRSVGGSATDTAVKTTVYKCRRNTPVCSRDVFNSAQLIKLIRRATEWPAVFALRQLPMYFNHGAEYTNRIESMNCIFQLRPMHIFLSCV